MNHQVLSLFWVRLVRQLLRGGVSGGVHGDGERRGGLPRRVHGSVAAFGNSSPVESVGRHRSRRYVRWGAVQTGLRRCRLHRRRRCLATASAASSPPSSTTSAAPSPSFAAPPSPPPPLPLPCLLCRPSLASIITIFILKIIFF
ncbi:hypothetical protein Scep_025476 [Stephania cephalantha]|uniref:Uncharacterized protein n=1 Tax=Stephania cephalantha TaxID=152367 RepID=A0AAP0ENJ3_9MAGN